MAKSTLLIYNSFKSVLMSESKDNLFTILAVVVYNLIPGMTPLLIQWMNKQASAPSHFKRRKEFDRYINGGTAKLVSQIKCN